MNLLDLNVGAGAPQTKPWLTPVCFSVEASIMSATEMKATEGDFGNLIGVNASFTRQIRPGGAVPLVSGAASVNMLLDSFLGGVGVIQPAGTGSLIAPASVIINATYPASVAGALVCFTVINRNINPAGPSIIGPDGAGVAIPAAQTALRATSTQFWYQKQASTQWTCVNAF